MSEETGFDFTAIKAQMDAKKAEKKQVRQQQLDSQYIKRRGSVLAASKEKTKQNRPESRLRNAWDKAWDELPEEQKNSVDVAHSEAALLWREINDAMKNMAAGIAHIQAPFIDLTFEAGKEFMAKQTGGGVFPFVAFAAQLSPEDFDAQQDDSWKRFGRFTTLPTPIWHNFLAVALAYVNSHPNDFEQSFREELEKLVPNHFPKPAPVPQSFRQSTKSEENATLNHKEGVAIQQRLGVGNARIDNIYS